MNFTTSKMVCFILGVIFISLCFQLITMHYHTAEQREIKFKPRIKLNHNIPCIHTCLKDQKACVYTEKKQVTHGIFHDIPLRESIAQLVLSLV